MKTAPSFSTTRKLTMGLNVALAVLSAVALLVMVNYLAARHFARFSLSTHIPVKLSPFTMRVLEGLTNHVKVIIYYDKQEALFDPVSAWLKEYKFASPKISIETVDYQRDPAAANAVEAKYKLNDLKKKNVIIFECNGRPPRIVFDSELSELDQMRIGKSKEIRRTHLKCEMMFTSAIQAVSNTRSLKAYLLQGHMEHRPDSADPLGYSMFATLLRQNNLDWQPLTLLGSAEVPSDCALLIIAGPSEALLNEELEKIDRYLKQGGRALVLFKPVIFSPGRLLGLEKLMANWGVEVGIDVVQDPKMAATSDKDMIIQKFEDHPLVRPLSQPGIGMYLTWPRSMGKLRGLVSGADAPKVDVLAWTTPSGHELTDISKDGVVHENAKDFVGRVPLMVAVEKGSIRGMAPDRGLTRMVVVGESTFLGNRSINSAGNREFLSHSLNWLLARNELLAPIGPQPIKEYKLLMSASQLTTVRWVLLLGFPGSVLLVGLLVSIRRRK